MSGASLADTPEPQDSGCTTLCHAWLLTRRDGRQFAFTDHDVALSFDNVTYRADAGLSALALSQGTGLAVDNTEAIGALSDASITEADLEQGRFDDAEVLCWRVNWADPSQRWLRFRGTLGEVRRAGGEFRAELRGLTTALNREMGRIYQKSCSAVLGDAACRVDLTEADFSVERVIETVEEGRVLCWPDALGYDAGWFAGGRLEVLEGPGTGLWGQVKTDRVAEGGQRIELWQSLKADVARGTRVRLVAGCDRRLETCRKKFDNVVNYRGFPDLPGMDWITAAPRAQGTGGKGSLR